MAVGWSGSLVLNCCFQTCAVVVCPCPCASNLDVRKERYHSAGFVVVNSNGWWTQKTKNTYTVEASKLTIQISIQIPHHTLLIHSPLSPSSSSLNYRPLPLFIPILLGLISPLLTVFLSLLPTLISLSSYRHRLNILHSAELASLVHQHLVLCLLGSQSIGAIVPPLLLSRPPPNTYACKLIHAYSLYSLSLTLPISSSPSFSLRPSALPC